jgi:phosphoribosylformylglycinamidine synthase PurS subunit
MKVQVFVRLKPGVLDVQGKAVSGGLLKLGFDQVKDVRIGKLIELEVEESDQERAKETAAAMCEKLLVNTIIESYEIRA